MLRIINQAIRGVARSVDFIWTDRRIVWQGSQRRYSNNPFNVKPGTFTREEYEGIALEAKERDFPEYYQDLASDFDHQISKDFVDTLAMSTQVTRKKSRILYAHGYLLYSSLRKFLDTFEGEPTILETGTARGYGTVCMAKALRDANRDGRIYTIDVLPADIPIYWNCIHDVEGPKTRYELLEQWSDLVEKFVIFVRGYSQLVLGQLGLRRVHFAFLDAAHKYADLHFELEFVAARQKSGDIIVCDDYNVALFPGVVRAVEEHLSKHPYKHKKYEAADGRGYVVCTRI